MVSTPLNVVMTPDISSSHGSLEEARGAHGVDIMQNSA
jgi:hypothetical protein